MTPAAPDDVLDVLATRRDDDTAGAASNPGVPDDALEELTDEVDPPTTREAVVRPATQPVRPPVPPPIPPSERRKRQTLAGLAVATTRLSDQLESPTVVDRALSERATREPVARAAQLARALDEARDDPRGAAIVAYELGELCSRRLADEERALDAHRRSFALDPTLRANTWALRRLLYARRAWSELPAVIDAEVACAIDARERADLLLERAHVLDRDAAPVAAVRRAIEDALQADSTHIGALLALEQALVRAGDRRALVGVWQQLAVAVDDPDLQVAYWLSVARSRGVIEPAAVHEAFETASRIAPASALTECVVRERLRIAESHDASHVDAALAGVVNTLMAAVAATITTSDSHPHADQPARTYANIRELVALCRRQAQRARGNSAAAAWDGLRQALALSPAEPVVLADLIELAAELGRYGDVPELAQMWLVTGHEAERVAMVSYWCAEAHRDVARRTQLRRLLASLDKLAPRLFPLMAAAECDALRDPDPYELASLYLSAASAVELGVALGPATSLPHDSRAAAAYYLQAAELFAFYVGNHAALEHARDAVTHALRLAPERMEAIEAAIDLDEVTGAAEVALGRIRKLLEAAPGDRALVDRSIRLARTHGLLDQVCALERELVAHAPDDMRLAWRLEATLAELGRDDERAPLLARLAQTDDDLNRRRTARLLGARLHQRLADHATAIELYRAAIADAPDDATARDLLLDLLRDREDWVQLVDERVAQARIGPARVVRRAFREAAWVLEARLGDVARAAQIYDEWCAQIPGDQAALEGVARCRRAIGEHAAESAARAAIAELDGGTEARWLLARSLERAGRYDEAAIHYGELADRDHVVVAKSALLALGELATRSKDVDKYVAATDALAGATTDAAVAAGLFADVGWTHALVRGDAVRAVAAFATSVELDPSGRGALLGAALAGAGVPGGGVAEYRALATATDAPAIATAAFMRAAVRAAAAGDVRTAAQLAHAARDVDPNDVTLRCLVADIGPLMADDVDDPFVATEQLVAHAELLEERAALADDPASRIAWQLDRAELLERAGQLDDAISTIADVLRQRPDERRALAAIGHIARRLGNLEAWARACYTLAKHTRDRASRIELLRSALDVFGAGGASYDVAFTISILRAITATDPTAPESELLLEHLRESGDALQLLVALTQRIEFLASANAEDTDTMIALLLERATVLRSLGHRDAALADVDAILARVPGDRLALATRAELLAPPADTSTNDLDGWDSDFTDAESLTSPAGSPQRPAARGPAVVRRATTSPVRRERSDPFGGNTPLVNTMDPFQNQTVVADLSALQEQERRTLQAAEPPAQELARVAPHVVRRSSGSIPVIASTPPAETRASAPRANGIAPPKLDLTALQISLPGVDETAVDLGAEPLLDADALYGAPDGDLSQGSGVVLLSYAELQPRREDETSRELLRYLEAEVTALDAANAAPLHVDIGRLAAAMGDTSRARAHFDAALQASPASLTALHELRRLAWADANLAEAARLALLELRVASERERVALSRIRVEMLLAAGEREAARESVHELLARAPRDVGLWLAELELVYTDHRDDVADVVGRFVDVVEDGELRGSLHAVRALCAWARGDTVTASSQIAAAIESHPSGPAPRLAMVRDAAARGDEVVARSVLLDLAYHVEGDDPGLAAAMAMRAQGWSALGDDPAASREVLSSAARLALQAAPRDQLVARIAGETALVTRDDALGSHAFALWARSKASPIERAYAAARAAELDPGRLGRLWNQVLELDPGDDYAVAQLRAAYLRAGERQHAIELDLRAAHDGGSSAALLRAATALIAADRRDTAIDVLVQGLERWPTSLLVADMLAETLAAAGRWTHRAEVWSATAAYAPAMIAADLGRLRASLAWERAADVALAVDDRGGIERVTRAALTACNRVLDDDLEVPEAHGAAILLASRLGDRRVMCEVLERAERAERLPWAKSSLALRRARIMFTSDPSRAFEVARAAGPGLDDPRTTVSAVLAAATHRDLGAAVDALAAAADSLDAADVANRKGEVAMLRIRSGCLAFDLGDVARARAAFEQVNLSYPGAVNDLLDAAVERAGERPPTRDHADIGAFVRVLRDAERAVERGDREDAIGKYRRALQLRPVEPLATLPLVEIAKSIGDADTLAGVAAAQVEAAEARRDGPAVARAYELHAFVAQELRDDPAAAQHALEQAVRADPTRLDLVLAVERELVRIGDIATFVERRTGELARLRHRQQVSRIGTRALAALLVETAAIADREGTPSEVLRELYRGALELVPRERFALFRSESILRRERPSEELANLEGQIAQYFVDPRSKAAYLTRAGDTLAMLGQAQAAVRRFAEATDALPSYQPALDAWHDTALDGQLWRDLADVVTRSAGRRGDVHEIAALYHFAGVALMDKANARELAIAALRRACDSDPLHGDAFLRLRILLDDASHRDELAKLLRRRLEIDAEPAAQTELHRALAEHYFTVEDTPDRKTALRHYRAVLAIDPRDVRAHAAIADIASSQLDWEAAVDAILARVPLERDERLLYTLYYRLGRIYAEHDAANATAAFQAALRLRPGDLPAQTAAARLLARMRRPPS